MSTQSAIFGSVLVITIGLTIVNYLDYRMDRFKATKKKGKK